MRRPWSMRQRSGGTGHYGTHGALRLDEFSTGSVKSRRYRPRPGGLWSLRVGFPLAQADRYP